MKSARADANAYHHASTDSDMNNNITYRCYKYWDMENGSRSKCNTTHWLTCYSSLALPIIQCNGTAPSLSTAVRDRRSDNSAVRTPKQWGQQWAALQPYTEMPQRLPWWYTHNQPRIDPIWPDPTWPDLTQLKSPDIIQHVTGRMDTTGTMKQTCIWNRCCAIPQLTQVYMFAV